MQTGEIHSRGIELEGKAILTEGFGMTTRYAYLDNVVAKANDNTKGKHPVGVPTHTASLWGDYTFQRGTLAGLGFGAGVRYVGSSYGDSENTFKVPDFTLADAAVHYDLAGLSYDLLKGVRLAVSASNLFDKDYVSNCLTVDLCFFGLRRTVLGTVSYRW